jgi:hypothetical protein
MRCPQIASFVVIFSLSLFSCGRSIPMPIGKWKAIAADPKFINSYHISNADLVAIIESSSLEFGKDGEFRFLLPNDTTKGNYTYFEKEKHIITESDDGRSLDYTIESMERSSMIIESQFGKLNLKRID